MMSQGGLRRQISKSTNNPTFCRSVSLAPRVAAIPSLVSCSSALAAVTATVE